MAVRDQNGNALEEGQFVQVELNSKLIKGHIQKIVEGGTLLASPNGQPPQMMAGKISIMCQVDVGFHPQMPVASNVARLVKPETEPAPEVEPEQTGGVVLN